MGIKPLTVDDVATMTNGTSACFSHHRTVSQKEEVVYLSFECGNLLMFGLLIYSEPEK